MTNVPALGGISKRSSCTLAVKEGKVQSHCRDACVDHAMRQAIEAVVTYVFGVDRRALGLARRGKQPVAHARQVAMYLAHVNCGLTLTQVGRLFSRDRTTVAHACLQIETRRDDPQFDRALDLLGWAIPTMIERSGRNTFLH